VQPGILARMFERFTDRARRVVVLAQEESRLLGHNYIGTEHILLGLLHEGEGIAAKALESLEISLRDARAQVERVVGHGGPAPPGHIPFTPRAKKVLELSLREALQLGHNYIGTEHVLLGLIREGEGVGAQVLIKLGVDLSRARQVVLAMLGGDVSDLGEIGTGPALSLCSFCGTDLRSVGRYLVGPRVVICDSCIAFAADAVSRASGRVLRLPPDVRGEPPDPSAAGEIIDAVRAVFSDASTQSLRSDALEDADRLAPLHAQARARVSVGQLDHWVEWIRFVRPDVAEVHLVFFPGELGTRAGLAFDGPVVRLDGRWKVGRELFGSVLRWAGVDTPP
jgi:hypothetical protein